MSLRTHNNHSTLGNTDDKKQSQTVQNTKKRKAPGKSPAKDKPGKKRKGDPDTQSMKSIKDFFKQRLSDENEE